MAETKKTYRKLPGVALSLLGLTRLWDGGDHVLQVSTAAAFESYRRYYLREIKALIVQPTSTGLAWNVVYGFLLILFVLGAYAFWIAHRGGSQGAIVGTVIMDVFAAIVALLLIFNVLRGKTCRVFFQTKAGVERLGAPVRLPAARRLREILAARIRAEQAETPAAAATEEAPAGAVLP